jgi:cell wall-associated NlpC family hydrolase
VRDRSHELAAAKDDLSAARGRLEELSARAEGLVEAYNGELVKLTAARAHYQETATRLDVAEQQVGLAHQAVTALALDSVSRIVLPPEIEALTGTADSALQRASMVDHLGGQQAAVLGHLEDVQQVAAILRVTAAHAYAAQESTAEEAELAKAAAEAAVEEQVALTERLEREKKAIAERLDAAMANVNRLRRQALLVRASGTGADAARWALGQVGKPYVWAAAGPSSYDCSGLTMRAWGQEGVTLDHWTGTQWTSGPHVPLNQLRPGDLLFFAYNPADPGTIHHVGMYVGRGLMVHAPQTGEEVQVSPFRRHDLVGATRPK